jgi:hypothetical protein
MKQPGPPVYTRELLIQGLVLDLDSSMMECLPGANERLRLKATIWIRIIPEEVWTRSY